MSALEEIKKRAEGHTEGPWRVWAEAPRKDGLSIETSWARPGEETELVAECYKAPDVELIAAAPKLLAALEAVERVRETMRLEEGKWMYPETRFARLLEEAIEEALR